MPASQGALTGSQTAASSLAEKYAPASQAAHVRSAVVDPGYCSPSPAGHVRHATQATLPGADLNVPPRQVLQVRSDISVAALSMNCPEGQAGLTFWQALPSLVLEYVPAPSDAGVHAVHLRSTDADPGADTPSPAGHDRHARHCPFPADALKVPVVQLVHVRSLVAVAALAMYSPAAQGALTASQALPSSALENCVTPLQVSHVRSATADPTVLRPWPTGHVFHAWQTSFPDVALNVPSPHMAHTRSELAPGATV